MNILTADITALETLDLIQLRQEWLQHYSTPAPISMSRELLMRAVGYMIQQKTFGGLNRRTLFHLASLNLNIITKSGALFSRATPPPKAGTKFIREWQGKVYEVLTLEDGQFSYAGKSYSSLTMIARYITNTHQSGPRFFGLKDKGIKGNG
jgi:Protein of unknown function (DUF2924)